MPDGVPITPGSGLGVKTVETPTNLTGTVAKAGTTALTGTTTAFLTELAVGDVVRVPGGAGTEDRVIATITSNTAATVTVAFANTASGQVGQRVEHVQVTKLATGPSTALNKGSVSSIGTSSSTPVAANPARVLLTLGNDSSSATIYLVFGTTAVVNSGLSIGPKQTVIITGDQWSGRMDAIATAASTNLLITEV